MEYFRNFYLMEYNGIDRRFVQLNKSQLLVILAWT